MRKLLESFKYILEMHQETLDIKAEMACERLSTEHVRLLVSLSEHKAFFSSQSSIQMKFYFYRAFKQYIVTKQLYISVLSPVYLIF